MNAIRPDFNTFVESFSENNDRKLKNDQIALKVQRSLDMSIFFSTSFFQDNVLTMEIKQK